MYIIAIHNYTRFTSIHRLIAHSAPLPYGLSNVKVFIEFGGEVKAQVHTVLSENFQVFF